MTELDQPGQLVNARDGEGVLPSVERDEDNLVTSQTDGRGRLTEYTYDENGNVLTIRDELSSQTVSSITGLFTDPVYKLGLSADEIITTDINNDGFVDLVAASSSGVSVLLGNGNGSFGNPFVYDTKIKNSRLVTLSDIDEDGFSDLVLVNFGNDGHNFYDSDNDSVVILFNAGDGTFTSETEYEVQSGVINIIVADLNGDSSPDIVTTSISKGNLQVLLGNGDGTLANPVDYKFDFGLVRDYDQPYLSDRNSIVVEDINGDGLGDFIAIQATNNGFTVLLNNGDGTFGEQSTYTQNEPLRFELGDVNNDGFLDIINSRSVLLNNGDGTFQTAANLPARFAFFKVVELNGDGFLDILTYSASTAYVLLNAGNGTFEATQYDITLSHQYLELVDLNGDGFLDLISSNAFTDTLSVRLNSGNGALLPSVDYTVIGSWVLEDVNGDGFTDLLADNSNDTMSVFLNKRDGSFANLVDYVATGKLIILEDVNGDNYPDAILHDPLNYRTADTVNLLLNAGDGTFEGRRAGDPRSEVVVGTEIIDVKLVDVNLDQILDLITVHEDFINIYEQPVIASVNLGNGDGTFIAPISYSVSPYRRANPKQLVVGDFNNDDNPDLFVKVGYSALSLLLGNGDGTFEEPTSVQTDSGDIITADVNGDSSLDLINRSYNRLSVTLGNGDGSFGGPTQYTVGKNVSDVVAVDVNNDGNLDLIGTNAEDDTVSVFLGLGDGTFGDKNDFEVGDSPEAVQGRDVNGDGFVDLIVANAGDNSVSVLLGSGDGTFGAKNDYEVGERPESVVVEDVDGDDLLDIVTENQDDNTISILLGLGDGSFVAGLPRDFRVKHNVDHIALGDLNLDNLPDLVTATYSYYDDTVSVRLNGKRFGENAGIGERRYIYDPIFNQVTSVTDELGRVTLNEIDPENGNLLSVTRVVGEIGGDDDVITRYTYTESGLMDTETDPLGRITNYDYDQFDRLVQVTIAEGASEESIQRYEYDLAGNLTRLIDGNGNRTSYEYDGRNRLVKTTFADGAVQKIEYDSAGNQVATVDENGNRTKYEYDVANRLVKVMATDPDGDWPLLFTTASYAYNNAGNLVSVVDALSQETRYEYDSRNRLVATINADGTEFQFRYDFDNNLIGNIDENGNETRSVYDARNRLIRSIDALGNVTQYTYDVVNQLIAVTDSEGNRTRYEL